MLPQELRTWYNSDMFWHWEETQKRNNNLFSKRSFSWLSLTPCGCRQSSSSSKSFWLSHRNLKDTLPDFGACSVSVATIPSFKQFSNISRQEWQLTYTKPHGVRWKTSSNAGISILRDLISRFPNVANSRATKTVTKTQNWFVEFFSCIKFIQTLASEFSHLPQGLDSLNCSQFKSSKLHFWCTRKD